MGDYYVYIMASRSGVLYTGITNNLMRRVWEHRTGRGSAFTARYRVHKLVYFETFADVRQAIDREKQVKAWRRSKRSALIATMNPGWIDLAADWFDEGAQQEEEKTRSLAHKARSG